MAGYNGFSKSNNAIEAENNGSYPLTKYVELVANKTGFSKKAVKEFVKNRITSHEWHHTSSHYNCTDYYSLDSIFDCEDTLAELTEFCKNYKPEAVKSEQFSGTINYVEWTGTRNHPKANNIEYKGSFEIKGNWVSFDGKRKKIDGNYIKITYNK